MRQRLLNPQTYLLRGASQLAAVQTKLDNLPLDDENPLEVVIRERAKPRRMSQNALMWAGPLNDIAEQAWVNGKRFTAEAWHEHFKREFLPEQFDPDLCLEGYVKWQITPRGDRVLVGSTTGLTVKGMAQYLTQIEAAGAELGVEFRTREARP
ncbi:NinB protein [Achromobacter sp. NFACC18-2]|nr:NinB protein [Achromobacter sp. NFACC18-2]